MAKKYEFRDPVHGFIELNEWERDIINQPAFQRLRRIKQLAWTDMVYPGATHTRFEHSLGVMHVATRMFDTLRQRDEQLLEELGYENLDRQRQLVRLAALLHDIGHPPFSHATEELFPSDPNTKKPYSHEQYSAAIVEHELNEVIENHPFNKKNFNFSVKDLTGFFRETPSKENLVLRNIVSGQMDADRMDYMLRDSHHAGVSYGRYDLNRIIATVKFVRKLESDDEYTVGIAGDGIHAAEGLIIARYMMFTQVYFHKTRVIYDYHLIEALKDILKDHGGSFPSLDSVESVRKYLKWDDWRVFGELAKLDTEHGVVLKERKHYRLVEETPEVPSLEDRAWIENLRDELEKNGMRVVQRDAEKSWYKFDNPGDEILVENEYGPVGKKVIPLSHRSSVVKGLPPVRQSRLYVRNDQRKKAEKIAQAIKPKV